MQPLCWWLTGIRGGFESSDIAFLLGLAFVNAGGSWALARWRGKAFVEISEPVKPSEDISAKSLPKTAFVADEIAKLSKLHESGALSNDEFQKAKDKLLNT